VGILADAGVSADFLRITELFRLTLVWLYPWQRRRSSSVVSTGLSDYGEEWQQKSAWRQDLITRDTTLEVLLFDDATDSLSDSSDVADITTEPTDGNYARQTVNLDNADVSLSISGGDLRAEATVTFDVDGTTGSVDAAATVLDFKSDIVNSESSQNAHHIYSATLDIGSVDLSQFTSLEVNVELDLT